MRWNYENVTTMLFGFCIGMWGSTWLAWVNPMIPFFLAYPVGAWVMWRTSEIVHHHRAALKSTAAKEGEK